MKILILTQYFPPEVGAPQNRLFEVALRLKKQGADITVLTAMPNYPGMKIHKNYQGKFRHYEEMQGLKIYRSWIFVSKSKSIFLRLLNYFSFVWTSFWSGWLRLGKFDYIICESPPLFLGISAFLLKKLKNAKLVFNVSDLWPESAEKLGLVKSKAIIKLAYSLEKFLYDKSEIITGQTQGIVKSIQSRFPGKKVFWIPNGVDLAYYNAELTNSNWRTENDFSENDFLLLYAGILGHAQGLEVMIRSAERLKTYDNIKFIFLGEGPLKTELQSLKHTLGVKNVYFADAVPKDKMPAILGSMDATIVPLKKLDLFLGAIPSKIFESLAMRKPILLGVKGEAKELFIDTGKAGLAFTPEDDKDLSDKILELYKDPVKTAEFGMNGLNYVKENFNRDSIAKKLSEILHG